MNKTFIVSLFLATSMSQTFAALPKAIQAAHEAYLDCDSQGLYDHVKEALKESKNHPLVLENTMSLMKTAKVNGCLDQVNPDFSIPSEIAYMEMEIQRKYRSEQGKVTFGVNGTIGVKKGHELETFQIIRYPNQVLIDLQANIGEKYPEVSDTLNEMWISGAQSHKPIQEGLYLVNVKLKGQPLVNAYVIVNDMNSSATPVVLSPGLDHPLKGSQPTFEWKPFSSPERKESEKARINLSVREQGKDDSDLFWVRLKDDRAQTFKVGDTAATRQYQGLDELKPGNYIFQISVREVEYFGDIGIRRASTTRVPFTLE